MLLDNCYAFSLLLYSSSLKKKFFEERAPRWHIMSTCPGSAPGPALDPPLGGFGPKVNINVQGHEYFIPTKFGEYPSSDSVVKADYVFLYIYMH